MTISVFELFRIGIGPSSSHTVGPMRAARQFAERLRADGLLSQVHGIRVQLYGSLGATGEGHGTVRAVVLGLAGYEPHLIDPDDVPVVMQRIRADGSLRMLGEHDVAFDVAADIELRADIVLPGHPNGMQFDAAGPDGQLLATHRAYSVGGGFVVDEADLGAPLDRDQAAVPYPYRSADQLVAMCEAEGIAISSVQFSNELTRRSADDIRDELLLIWKAMRDCV